MRRSKYNSHRTGDYDSEKEARRAWELDMQQRAGMITDLKKQVKFVLIPAQREPGEIGPRGGFHPGKLLEHECSYIADFTYKRDGKTVVEDCKGVRTADYIIKRKLMLYIHGVRIYET